MADKLDYQYKILILGDATVGKTSILIRYTENTFDSDSLSTLGVDVKYKYVTMNNKKIRMNIWDTAGQDRFKNIAKNYFKGANAVIFVYDVNVKQTIEKIKYWINSANENTSKDVVGVIVGNKIDMRENHEIMNEQIKSLADKYDMETFETSAKTGEGISEVFTYLVQCLLKKPDIGLVLPDDESISRKNSRPLDKRTFSTKNKHTENCNC